MTAAPNRAVADRECPHCKSALPRLATVCPSCGRWAVSTRLSDAAQFLRIIGYAWIVLSLIGAVMLGLGNGPLGGVAGGVATAMQGLLIGFIAVVVAERGPRQPD